MKDQGGNMLIEFMLVGLLAATVVMLLVVKKEGDKTDPQITRNSQELTAIHQRIKKLRGLWDELNTSCSHNTNYMEANKLEIDTIKTAFRDFSTLKARSDNNDKIFADKYNTLVQRINSIPKEIKVINKTQALPLAHPDMEVRGYEWLTVRKGKKVKAVKYWTVPRGKKKDKNFRMPGIKEAKDKIVEAGL